ncbi:MAG: DUF1002 domain-containing protein [Clostridium sp.]|nr:DUF1002 domain-containing protein [Clostridium sp.]
MIKKNFAYKATKLLTTVSLMTLLFLSMSLTQLKVDASELDGPVYSYGESLTAQEKERTADLLGVKKDSKEIEVRINEMNTILHNSYNYNQVYSSVYMESKDTNEGVSVEIITPNTITRITPAQYQNAAITAGAVNLSIKIASVKAVDGSGALAGVYKAFSDANMELPQENIEVAQEELEETSQISEDNEGKEGYSDELLNAAIADIKDQIQKEKDENDGTITQVNITNIVNNVLNNYNLNDILSEENKERLISLMQKFSELEFTAAQKEAIKEFGQGLIDKGGDLMDSVKSTWENLDDDVKTGITGFFQNIFDAIKDFFSGLF